MGRSQCIYSDRVLTGSDTLVIGPALVEVRDGHIARVTHQPRSEVDWDALTIEDLGDRLVTPAFVNGHTHLSMCMFRGLGLDAMASNIVEETYYRVETKITAEDVEAFTRMGAYESMLCGVGAVWDHYYHADAVARALADTGLGGVVAPTLQDRFGPGVEQLERQLEITVELANSSALKDKGIHAALGPHATDTVSDALWKRVADIAESENLSIHAHVAQSIEEQQRSVDQHGCSPIERLHRLGALSAGPGMLLVHGLFVSADDIARLDVGRHVMGYCPYSQVQFGFPAAFEDWIDAGLPYQLGTDCGACNDTMNVQQELRILAHGRSFALAPSPAGERFRASGAIGDAVSLDNGRRLAWQSSARVTAPTSLLAAVWSVPGNAAPGLMLGELAAGRRANIAVWDLEHPNCWPAADPLRALTMSDMSSALWNLMLNGDWKGEPGNFARSILQSPDFAAARTEANARLGELMEKVDLSHEAPTS